MGREDLKNTAQRLKVLTAQLFRCRGYSVSAQQNESTVLGDLFGFLLAVLALSAWYLMLYLPLCEKNHKLEQRKVFLEERQKHKTVTLNRLERELNALESNNPEAWERAARIRLGWIREGEVLNIVDWRKLRKAVGADPLQPPAPPPIEERPNRRFQEAPRVVLNLTVPHRQKDPAYHPSTQTRWDRFVAWLNGYELRDPIPIAPASPYLHYTERNFHPLQQVQFPGEGELQ